jgi:(2Fe-2S) ferredoxin
MPSFVRHVFVCGNERPAGHPRGCCKERGGDALRDALKAELKKAGAAEALGGPVRINGAGCLDQCEHGPCLVVYPDNIWYGLVKAEDVPEIVREHIVDGRPVERLRLPDACLNTKTCPHRK